jgi:RNA polymerase sigma-70 factor (ECF subfamily)
MSRRPGLDEPQDEPRSDTELIDAVNAGDVAAFEALYRRHRDWVVNLAYRFTRDRELALDVLQETFVYFLGKFPGFELTASLRTFLYPVVRHLAVAAQSRRPPTTGAGPAQAAALPEAAASPDETLRRLTEIVDDLPLGHREVLLLRFVDGLSLAQIAAAMEIPLGTVKSRLHNALEALRRDERTKKYFGP